MRSFVCRHSRDNRSNCQFLQEWIARRGGVRRGSALDCGCRDPGSIPGIHTCGPSDGKDVKDVFGRPSTRVGVGLTR